MLRQSSYTRMLVERLTNTRYSEFLEDQRFIGLFCSCWVCSEKYTLDSEADGITVDMSLNPEEAPIFDRKIGSWCILFVGINGQGHSVE